MSKETEEAEDFTLTPRTPEEIGEAIEKLIDIVWYNLNLPKSVGGSGRCP